MKVSTTSEISCETKSINVNHEEHEYKATRVSMLKQSANVGGKISFNVMKKQTTKIVAQNKLVEKHEMDYDEDEQEDRSRKRGILRFEDGVVISTEEPKKKKEKTFIIPVLKLSSEAQIVRLRKLIDEGTATEQDKARLALLLECLSEYNVSNTAEKITLPSTGTLPTIVEPDELDPDYESMPVGEFGLAFLRGCGWKNETSAIGKTNAQAVPLRITKPRPKGLGLGAVLPEAPTETRPSKEAIKTTETDDIPTLGKNSYVRCTGGLNNGAYGQVRSMDEENSSVFVELTWPLNKAGKTVRLSQFAIKCISQREYLEQLHKNYRSSTQMEKH